MGGTGPRGLLKVPRDGLIERLRDDASRMTDVFAGLTDEDWTGLMVPHPYMGPSPAMFYPVFQLVDYAVHAWDVREGIGEPHGLDGDAADLLGPVIFVLWQATADVSGVDQPFTVGVRTSGHNGGDTRVDVSADGMQYAPGDVSDCPAVLEFDPATFVLTGYARMNGGTVRGDGDLAHAAGIRPRAPAGQPRLPVGRGTPLPARPRRRRRPPAGAASRGAPPLRAAPQPGSSARAPTPISAQLRTGCSSRWSTSRSAS